MATCNECIHQIAVHDYRSRPFEANIPSILDFSVLTAFHTLSLLHFLPLQSCSYRIFHSRIFNSPS